MNLNIPSIKMAALTGKPIFFDNSIDEGNVAAALENGKVSKKKKLTPAQKLGLTDTMIKKGEIMENREYNTQRTCGVWLVYIGVIIIVSVISGGELLIQPFILGFGYAIGYLLIFVLPFLNRKLAYGKNSKFQDKMDNITIIVTVILCTFCSLFIGFENLRLVWLSIFIVVGLHFFGFYFSQGKLMIVLGTLTVINGLLGILIINIPFLVVVLIDGALKIVIGFKMLFGFKRSSLKNSITFHF